MTITIKTGATLTGGTDLVYSDSGQGSSGERVFASTTSTILEPRQIKIKATIPTTTSANPGSSRSEVRFILGSRVQDEGCCTVSAGTVMASLTTAWPLTQPVDLVDELIDQIRGFVYTDEFVNLLKQGRIPN